ncbi:MAG: type VII toxin-antitoxin system MntA family adenylyltransferase antitoxin [Thermoanaerobaculia bacterium]
MRAALELAPADVVSAYLFGSQARGTARAASDIDVALLLEKDPEPKLQSTARRLEGDLERALRRPVEVLVLNRAAPDLVHRVLRDGRVLLDRDRPARLRFEVQARNEYFDLQPILRRYRRGRL